MQRLRIILLAVLIASPLVFLMAAGSYFLWERGWSLWAWIPMTASMALAAILAWHWQRRRMLLQVDFNPPLHWTDRDRQAWKLVEARAKAAESLPPEKFDSLTLYTDTAMEMAQELSRFFHPKSTDPIGSLTIPEILAVLELSAHDLAEMAEKYLPAGHLLTIDHWRSAKKASDWYQNANQIYWLISAIFSPLNTGLRYLTSELGIGRPLQMLQRHLILWFYTAYLHRLGTYLIEVNSGRLRVGATRYRELMNKQRAASADSASVAADPAESVPQVTLTLIGQVKTGKSSLINALLGEQRAKTGVLPETNSLTRYELQHPGIATRLVLFDSAGYGHQGPRADQLTATLGAARQSDLVLLVMHARNPARQADVTQVEALKGWFARHPDLKAPPILGVLTHIDLLSPSLEWQPPYNWQEPNRPKEENISQALAAVREQLGDFLTGVVPVCTAPDRVYGVSEWLLPAVSNLLDEAHAVAFLRCLRAEADTGKARRVFHQLLAAGQGAAKVLWQMLHAKPK